MSGRIVAIAVTAVAGLIIGPAVPAAAAAGPGAGRAAPEPRSLALPGWGAAGFARWLSARPGSTAFAGNTAFAGSTASWPAQPTPNPGMPNASLAAVSCTGQAAAAPASCTAVGGYEDDYGTGLTLAERRTGGTWAVQATPNPAGAVWSGLDGVSCATATDCVAVGWYVTAAGNEVSFAQRWNGRRWTVQAVPSPAGATSTGLFGVSCAAKAGCTAVGEYIAAGGGARALAARWNGIRWTVQPVPVPLGSAGSELSGVSCVPAGTCLAAGATATASTQLTLAARWDGTSWHVTPVRGEPGAQGAGFTAIACGSALSCVAVGSYGAPSAGGSPAALAEAWNGTGWHLLTVPVPPPGPQTIPASAFEAVSCAPAGTCAAVGAYSPGAGLAANLAESWNGTRWVIRPAPDPAGNTGSGLSGVSCAAKAGCAAAGTYYVQQPADAVAGVPIPGLALAESWNGTRWTIDAARDKAGAVDDSELNAIACPSPRTCTAVGDYITSAGLFAPLAERRAGGRWVIEPVTDPGDGTENFLDGVSCPAPAACTAVGFSVQFTSGTVALAERWNGTRWRAEPIPLPAHALGDRLFAVSCPTASDCVAVGDYLKGSTPLAERWNGTGWRVLAVPVPADTSASGLSGISCTGPRACVAVGYRADDKGNQRALAEVWNGARWRTQAIASPQGTSLAAVSCSAPGACTAVGQVTTLTPGPGPVASAPFAVRWNGTRWTRQPVPGPASGGWLSGVSCAGPRACTAAGGEHTASAGTVVMARTWSGTRWAVAPAVNPAPAFESVLEGVACTAPRACTAVGSYQGLTNAQVTLAMTETG